MDVADIIETATSSATRVVNPDVNSVLANDPSIYDKDFQEIFEGSFDPPKSRPMSSLQRLQVIDMLKSDVRSLL
jgi:hypothetical protein